VRLFFKLAAPFYTLLAKCGAPDSSTALLTLVIFCPFDQGYEVRKVSFLFLLLLLWGYTVTFIKMIVIYHTWIHPLSFSFILLPCSWNSFNRSHFSIFRHDYKISPPYSPSHTLSLYLPPPTGANPQTGPVLPSCSTFLRRDVFV
jgi:hypothetical protein